MKRQRLPAVFFAKFPSFGGQSRERILSTALSQAEARKMVSEYKAMSVCVTSVNPFVPAPLPLPSSASVCVGALAVSSCETGQQEGRFVQFCCCLRRLRW